MPLITDRQQDRLLIRVEGEFTLASAAELKSLLLEGLAASQELQLDLAGAVAIDATLLQLLWAAGREYAGRDAPLVTAVSEAAACAARASGFERFPGTGDTDGARG